MNLVILYVGRTIQLVGSISCCQVMVGIDQDLHDEPKLLGYDLSC